MQAMGAKLLRARLRKTPRAGLSEHTPASLTWRPTDLYVDRKFDDAGSNLRVQAIQKEYQLQFSPHRCGADGIMKDSPTSSSKACETIELDPISGSDGKSAPRRLRGMFRVVDDSPTRLMPRRDSLSAGPICECKPPRKYTNFSFHRIVAVRMAL